MAAKRNRSRTRTKKKLSEQVSEVSKTKVKRPVSNLGASLVGTGITVLNCAMSDGPFGGPGLGKMINIIGDSDAGKTIVALNLLATAANDKRFKNHKIIYDDVEHALEFDISYMFGKKLAERMEAPRYYEDGSPCYSATIEDMSDNIHNLLDEEIPFIKVVDSFDALTAEAELEKVKEDRTKREKGEDTKGSYHMVIPKMASQLFRQITNKLKNTESLLIIVSQTRDDISPLTFTKKTRSGGKALKFYSSHEMWLASKKRLKKKVNKIDHVIGTQIIVSISKNKLTGRKYLPHIEFPIYYDYGCDDIGSMIDWMLAEKFWNKKKSKIVAEGLDVQMNKSKLISHIEENDLERKLQKIVGAKWSELSDTLKLGRKPRYQPKS